MAPRVAPYVMFLYVARDVFVSYPRRRVPLAERRFWRLEALGSASRDQDWSSSLRRRHLPGFLGPYEAAFLTGRSYPALGRASLDRAALHYWFCDADLGHRRIQARHLPRFDVSGPAGRGVDTELWRGESTVSPANGRNGEVTVVHAPNHRAVKATASLVEAVDELREEGLRVRLDLLERRPNAEVRRAVLDCDIVAEQFPWRLRAVRDRGHGAGKPVLSNSRSWHGGRRYASISDCPIVVHARDAPRPATSAGHAIRPLREAGRETSSAYALRRHSLRGDRRALGEDGLIDVGVGRRASGGPREARRSERAGQAGGASPGSLRRRTPSSSRTRDVSATRSPSTRRGHVADPRTLAGRLADPLPRAR